MKKITLSTYVLILVFSVQVFAQTGMTPGARPQAFSDFFDASTIPSTSISRALNASSSDHSNELQNLIDNTTQGVLTITGPSIIRIRNIDLKSNFHLKFDPSITLQLPDDRNEKAGTLFRAGNKVKIENFALTSSVDNGNNEDTSTWFHADIGRNSLPDTNNRVFISIAHAENFKIAGVNITDNATRIACLTMSPSNADGDQRLNVPTNGLIMNLRMLGRGLGGFGLIQTQAAINVLFYNLTALGGSVLRLESGGPQVNVDRAGGPVGNVITLDDVFIRKVRTIDGNATLALSPHRVIQGVLDADDIIAESTTLAMHIGRGFRDGNKPKEPGDLEIDQRGSFDSNSIFTNITLIGGLNAKYGIKGRKFLSCEERLNATEGDEFRTIRSRSLAAVEYKSEPESLGGPCPEGTGTKDGGCYTVNLPNPSDIAITNPDDIIFLNDLIISGNEKRSITNDDGTCCDVGEPCTGGDPNGRTVDECIADCESFLGSRTHKDFRKCRQACQIDPNHVAGSDPTLSTIDVTPNKDSRTTLYPNPTSFTVNISEASDWKLYDARGNFLAEDTGTVIDFSFFENGIYFVVIKGKSYKILKN